MPRHDSITTAFTQVLELLTEHGFDGMANALQDLLNEAMELERSAFPASRAVRAHRDTARFRERLQVKRVATRAGAIDLRVPQVRGLPDGAEEGFYPHALERGVQRARAQARDRGDVRARRVDATRGGDHARAVRRGRVVDAGLSCVCGARRGTRGVAQASARSLRVLGARRALRESASRRLGRELRGAVGHRHSRRR